MSGIKDNRSYTKRIVISAVLSALSFVLLFIGAATSVLDLTMLIGCAFCSVFAVIELRKPFPILIWAVTGILSLLFLPDKFVAVEYILFGGIYPIVKQIAERVKSKPISWLIKLGYFNLSLTVAIALAVFLFNLPEDYGMTFSVWVYVLGNLFFVMTDVCVTLMITAYVVKLRSRLKIDTFLK